MKRLFILFFVLLVQVSCNSKRGSTERAVQPDETQQFLKNFIPGKYPFKTDGLNYVFANGEKQEFKDEHLIYRNKFRFLNQPGIALPDSFYPGVYFDCGRFYLCIIRGFTDKLNVNNNDWTSTIITFDSIAILDVMPSSTLEHPGDLYKRCWIQKPDDDSIPLLITRILEGEGIPGEGGLDDPEVYKIINGKFTPASIKIDTVSYEMVTGM